MTSTDLTPRQAADQLGVCVATVYRWIEKGTLPAEEVAGTRYRVARCDLERLRKPVVPRGGKPLERKPAGNRGVAARKKRTREILAKAGLAGGRRDS